MSYQNLLAYKKSFELAMAIFVLTKEFPREERYSLTDQVRRSSRSVTATIAEAYRKRSYRKYFLSKLSDCDAENAETQTWLTFAFHCKYLEKKKYLELIEKSKEIGSLINFMMRHPEKFDVRS